TVARRDAGNLDRRADYVCSRRKSAAGRNGISHRGRVGGIAAIGRVNRVPNTRAPDTFARGENIGGTLIVVTVIRLGEEIRPGGEDEENHQEESRCLFHKNFRCLNLSIALAPRSAATLHCRLVAELSGRAFGKRRANFRGSNQSSVNSVISATD